MEKTPYGTNVCSGCFSKPNGVNFARLFYEMALVYLDDLIVFGKNFDERLKRLQLILQRLAENELKIKGSKCNFFPKTCQLLGHIISESGVDIDPEKVRAVEKMKEPSSMNVVRAFLSEIYSGFRQNSRTSLHFTE